MAKIRDPYYLLLALTLALMIGLNIVCRRPVFVSDIITLKDQVLEYRLKPNLDGATVVIPNRPMPVSFLRGRFNREWIKYRKELKRTTTFRVNTNSRGFRGKEFSPKPPPGTCRIVCLGDSVTFGWGLTEEESYPRVLERYLNSRTDKPVAYEVINAGVPGYTMEQIILRLVRDIIVLEPDLVTFCEAGDLQATRPREKLARHLRDIAGLSHKEKFNATFLYPPRSSFDRLKLTPQFRGIMEETARDERIPFVDFLTLLDQASANRGLKLEVSGTRQKLVNYSGGTAEVVFETDFQPSPDSPELIGPDIFRFLDRTDYAEALMFDDGHPNAEGARLMGEYLGKRLLEEGIVK